LLDEEISHISLWHQQKKGKCHLYCEFLTCETPRSSYPGTAAVTTQLLVHEAPNIVYSL